MPALPLSSPLIRALALLLIASACAPAFAQKVYQWKDAKGVTHYSDSPPPNQQTKDRRIDNRGEPAVEATAVGKSVESPQCATAKLNLQVLGSKSSVQQDTDGDGKPDRTLTDDDRASEREVAAAQVKAYCKPAA